MYQVPDTVRYAVRAQPFPREGCFRRERLRHFVLACGGCCPVGLWRRPSTAWFHGAPMVSIPCAPPPTHQRQDSKTRRAHPTLCRGGAVCGCGCGPFTPPGPDQRLHTAGTHFSLSITHPGVSTPQNEMEMGERCVLVWMGRRCRCVVMRDGSPWPRPLGK